MNDTRVNVALAELQIGHDPASVAARYAQIYQRASADQSPFFVVVAIHGLGLTTAKAGDAHAAVLVLAAAAAAYEKHGFVLGDPERIVHAQTIEALRSQLGEDRFASAWGEGRGLSPEEAATIALEAIDAGRPTRPSH